MDGEQMIKGVGLVRDKSGERPLLIIGIDGENVSRMVAGEPITFEVADMGLAPLQVVMLYGDHEADLVTMLGPLLSPHAVIHDQQTPNGG